jgi:DNA invertase Pin-like site-specific DNA recombinase
MARKRPALNPARAVGYLRVSTEEQHLGPEAQLDALTRWCAGNGVELVAVFTDAGVSGGAELDKRPALLDALAALPDLDAGVFLVAKRDRLARDVTRAAMIEARTAAAGARVVSAAGEGSDADADDPAGLLMRRLVDVFAEYERAMIRTRTRAALAVKARRGERCGGVPIGRTVAADGVRLEVCPVEARALDTIRELRTAGLSIRAVADELTRRGVPARGQRWYATTVARAIARG